MVPKGIATEDTVRYTSVGWAHSPEYVAPMSEESKKAILTTLVAELKENFGVKVSSCLDMARDRSGGGTNLKYLTVGGSNSGRLGDELESMGRRVDKASIKGVSEGDDRHPEMKMDKEAVVIFTGLANGLYYAEDEDGERTLPKKDKEGKFHCE